MLYMADDGTLSIGSGIFLHNKTTDWWASAVKNITILGNNAAAYLGTSKLNMYIFTVMTMTTLTLTICLFDHNEYT